MKSKILYQGAEAKLVINKYIGNEVIEKRRISKGYRIKEIDEMLIKTRTREEAKLIHEARVSGVSVPTIFDINQKNGIITMEYIKGQRVKDILNDLSKKEREKLCTKIGENIARLHNNDIIHGDITTSNILLKENQVYFIDFGLGEKNSEVETKGVDLHVLMEAFESTHSQYPKCFKYVLDGYKKTLKQDPKPIIKKIKEIIRRGRYR